MGQEIIIAGAGVAGLTAAITLAQAGRAVRIFERNPAAGSNRFPEWDAVENWTSLEDLPHLLTRIGIDPTCFRHVGKTDFSVIDPFGKKYDVKTPRPFFYLIKRGAAVGGLEHGLQTQAELLGIPIDTNTPCPPGQADIWATGTSGPAARFVSTGFSFHTDYPDCVIGLVDARVAPRAYAYLVVVDGEGTLAVVLTQNRAGANQLLERAALIFKKKIPIPIGQVHKSGGSGGDLAAFWAGQKARAIGEAAGFQDYLWGFGIRHALTSGYLAAQAILNQQDWQAVADAEIRPLVRASLVNRWIYDHMPNFGYALFIRYFAQSADLNALVNWWYHPKFIHQWMWPFFSRYFDRQAAKTDQTRFQYRTREVW